MAADQIWKSYWVAIKKGASSLCFMAILTFSACAQPVERNAGTAEVRTLVQQPGKPVALAIHGFNYTDTYIPSFEVNNQGGGNIFVSSPTSGGGGTVCCLNWRPGTRLPQPVKVVWSRDRKRWCQKTVMLNGSIPENPTAIGVHFMPDGDVQVEITEGYPKLKLKLDLFDDGRRKETGNVIHDEKTASCKDGR